MSASASRPVASTKNPPSAAIKYPMDHDLMLIAALQFIPKALQGSDNLSI
jgi:hypothetical protein